MEPLRKSPLPSVHVYDFKAQKAKALGQGEMCSNESRKAKLKANWEMLRVPRVEPFGSGKFTE